MMIRSCVKIEGMSCGMCEAHICDVIRRTVPAATKVSASHKKGEAVFLSPEAVEEAALRAAIDETGYRFLSMSAEPYEKRGLFGRK